jgi:hypothetical protein
MTLPRAVDENVVVDYYYIHSVITKVLKPDALAGQTIVGTGAFNAISV